MKNPNNDSIKRRYKMYKAGKNWLYAPLLFLSLGAGVYMGGQAAQAATTDEDHKVAVTAPAPEANAPAGEVTLTAPAAKEAVEAPAATPEAPAVTPAPVAEQAQEMVDGRPLDQEEVDDENLVLDVTKVDTANATQVEGLMPRANEARTVSDMNGLFSAIDQGVQTITLSNNITIRTKEAKSFKNKTFTIDGQGKYWLLFNNQEFRWEAWNDNQATLQFLDNSNVTLRNVSISYSKDNNALGVTGYSSNMLFNGSNLTLEGKITLSSDADNVKTTMGWNHIAMFYGDGAKACELVVKDGADVQLKAPNAPTWITQNFGRVTVGKTAKIFSPDLKMPDAPFYGGFTGMISFSNQEGRPYAEYFIQDGKFQTGLKVVGETKEVYYFQPTDSTKPYEMTIGKTKIPGHGEIQYDFGNEGKLWHGIVNLWNGVNSLADTVMDLLPQSNLNAELAALLPATSKEMSAKPGVGLIDIWDKLQKENNKILQTIVDDKKSIKQTVKYQNAINIKKEAFDQALRAGVDLMGDVNASPEEVKLAIQNIINAEKQLDGKAVDKSKLKQKVDQADNIRAGENYKMASDEAKQKYEDAVKRGQEILAKQDATQNDVNGALGKLIQAENNLKESRVDPVNKQALLDALAEAKEIKKKPVYTKASDDKKQRFDATIQNGEQVRDNQNATQPQVEAAVQSIKRAQGELDGRDVNKTDLDRVVKEASKVKESSLYFNTKDENLKKAYDDKVADGQKILDQDDADQPMVDQAFRDIVAAKGALNGQRTNKDQLRELLRNAPDVVKNVKYLKASGDKQKAYNDEIAKGKALDQAVNATQVQVDQSVENIKAALAALDGAEKEKGQEKDPALEKAKHDAKHAIEEAEEKKNREIDGNQSLTDEEKTDLENRLTPLVEKALENIDDAPTVEEVEKAKNEGLANINGVTVPKKSTYKEKAKDAIIDAKDKKNKQIEDAPGLDEDKKQELTADVNEKAEEAMHHIDEAPTNDMVDKAKDAGIKAIEGIQIPAPAKPEVDPGTDPKPADPSEKPEDAAKELDKAKADAKQAIDDAKNKKDAEIAKADHLDPEAKKELTKKVDDLANDAKKKIDEKNTKPEVEAEKQKGLENINGVQVPAKPAEEQVDLTKLKKVVEESPKNKQNHTYFNAADQLKKAYDDKVTEGAKILTDAEKGTKPTARQVQDAYNAIVAAKSALDGKPTNTQELQALLAEATKLKKQPKYTLAGPDKKKAYDQAWFKGVQASANPKTTPQKTVDEAVNLIKAAKAGLNGDAKDLQNKKDDAKKAIDAEKAKKDAEIDAKKLTPEAKTETKKKVQKAADEAKENINKAPTGDEVTKAKDEGIKKIQEIQIPAEPGEVDPKGPEGEKPGEQPGGENPSKPAEPGEQPQAPGEKPGEGEPSKPTDPQKPEGNKPGEQPGGEEPSKPAEPGEQPQAPGEKPGEQDPKVPGSTALDLTELAKLVDEAKDVRRTHQYFNANDDLKKAYDDKIKAGAAIKDNFKPGQTQTDVDNAVKGIKEAKNALNGPETNTDELVELLKQEGPTKQSPKYKLAYPDKKKAYDTAVKEGRKVNTNFTTTPQTKVDAAVQKLKDAFNALNGEAKELEKEKQDAKQTIDDAKTKKDGEFDDAGLDPESKEKKKDETKKIADETKQKIDEAATKDDVKKAKEEGIKKIQEVVVPIKPEAEKPGAKDPSKPEVPGDQPTDPKGPEGEEPGTKPEGEQPSVPGAPSDKPGEVDPSKPTDPKGPEGDKPANPGEKPGEEGPSKPTEPQKPEAEKPTDPQKPGGEDPSVPGTKPEGEQPSVPGAPSDKPGEVGPSQPTEPKTPEGEKPEDAAKELEKAKEDAKQAIDDAKKKKDAEIAKSDHLKPEAKEELNKKVDDLANDAKKKIDEKKTKPEVEDAKQKGLDDINGVQVPEKPAEEQVDLTKLKKVVAEAPNNRKNHTYFNAMDTAKDNYDEKIALGDKILSDAEKGTKPTAQQVQDAYNAIVAAKGALDGKPTNTQELQALLAEATKLKKQPKYTLADQDKKDALDQAKAKGEQANADPKKTPQATVDEAVKNLKDAIAGLNGDAKDLQNKKDDANKAIDAEKAKKDAEIDAKKLTPEAKTETKNKVQKAADEAKENINKAPTGDEVTKAKEDGIKKIQGIEIPAEPGEVDPKGPEGDKPANPGEQPGGEDPSKPTVPGEQPSMPGTPGDKPGTEKPMTPEVPGGQPTDPKGPEGEVPGDPSEKPGEQPSVPGTPSDKPGEGDPSKPTEPQKPEGDKPANPGEKPGGEDPSKPAVPGDPQKPGDKPGEVDPSKPTDPKGPEGDKPGAEKPSVPGTKPEGEKPMTPEAPGGQPTDPKGPEGEKPEDAAKELEKAKTDAKKEVDDAKKKKDAELDTKLDPQDAEKKKAETKKIADDTKKKIDEAQTKDDVNKAKEEGIKKIEDVVVPTKPEAEKPMTPETPKVDDKVKEDAKKEIDDAKKKKDAEIDDSKTLKPEEKAKKKDDVKKIVDDTKKKIDDAKTNDDVKKEKEKGLEEIGKVEVPKTPMTPETPMTPQGPQTPGENPEDPAKALEKAKTDAKKALDDAKTKKDGELDAKLDPKDAEKKKAETKKIADDAKKKVDDAKTKDEVNKAKEDGIKALEEVVVPTKPGEMPGMPMNPQNPMTPQGPQTPGENPEDPAKALEKAKQDAKKALDDAENKKNGEIDNGNLTPEEKKNLKNKVMGIVSQTKKMIDDAKTKDQVNDAKCDGLVAINGIHVPMMPAAPAPMNPMPGAMPQTNGQQMMTTDHGMTKMAMPKTTAMQDHMQMTTDQMMAKKSAMKELPQTGEEQDKALGILGMSAAGLMTMLGIGKYASRKRKN